jgi:hypothetical protein
MTDKYMKKLMDKFYKDGIYACPNDIIRSINKLTHARRRYIITQRALGKTLHELATELNISYNWIRYLENQTVNDVGYYLRAVIMLRKIRRAKMQGLPAVAEL